MVCLVLAGCMETPRAVTHIALHGDEAGLAVEPDGRRIDFGRAPSGVIAPLDRELGPHREMGLGNCPEGVVKQLAWGSLVLSFSVERFVGWRDASGQAGRVCAG
jgi:hypothetical protein